MICNGKSVLIVRESTGTPVNIKMFLLFRMLVIFATVQLTLMEMMNTALLRDFLRVQQSACNFELFTLIARCVQEHCSGQGLKQICKLRNINLSKRIHYDIVEGFKDFYDPTTKKWCIDHDIPQRPSHLFYGPPGVDKASTIRALAGTVYRRTCFLYFGDPSIWSNS